MSHSVTLAVSLDAEMLGRHSVVIYPPWTHNSALPKCVDLAAEVGDRYLLKYVRTDDRTRYSKFSGISHFPGVHYLTPTAICRGELVAALNLPPLPAPRFALILDPAKLDAVGPRQVRGGKGVEYVLLNGFPVDAMVEPGWPVSVD